MKKSCLISDTRPIGIHYSITIITDQPLIGKGKKGGSLVYLQERYKKARYNGTPNSENPGMLKTLLEVQWETEFVGVEKHTVTTMKEEIKKEQWNL